MCRSQHIPKDSAIPAKVLCADRIACQRHGTAPHDTDSVTKHLITPLLSVYTCTHACTHVSCSHILRLCSTPDSPTMLHAGGSCFARASCCHCSHHATCASQLFISSTAAHASRYGLALYLHWNHEPGVIGTMNLAWLQWPLCVCTYVFHFTDSCINLCITALLCLVRIYTMRA